MTIAARRSRICNGSLLLAGPSRPGVGFRAEAIVLNDSATGMVGRAVWTDERGDQVYSELRGEGTATGNRIVGTFLGGTGRYAGATGTYEFSWQFVLETEDGTVQGQSVGLKGRVRVGAPPATPAREVRGHDQPRLCSLRRALPFALAIGIWFAPVPAGLTRAGLASLRGVHRGDRVGAGRARSRCSRRRCWRWRRWF